MTKTKEQTENPDNSSSKLTEERKAEHVEEELNRILGKSSGDGFWTKARKVFFGTLYCVSMAVFSVIFGLVAAVLLPILLPVAYVIGKKKDPFTGAANR